MQVKEQLLAEAGRLALKKRFSAVLKAGLPSSVTSVDWTQYPEQISCVTTQTLQRIHFIPKEKQHAVGIATVDVETEMNAMRQKLEMENMELKRTLKLEQSCAATNLKLCETLVLKLEAELGRQNCAATNLAMCETLVLSLEAELGQLQKDANLQLEAELGRQSCEATNLATCETLVLRLEAELGQLQKNANRY